MTNASIKNFTPREIVSELHRYIIGQNDAKRAVAIAVRNRWRRQQVSPDLRDEIAPKNIIMIGPTGVGKTEIARRLSKLTNAPFIKVEASKFTEVGYVGKDVESMIRDLVDISINLVKAEEEERVQVRAEELAEERLLDYLLPRKPKKRAPDLQENKNEDIFDNLLGEDTEDLLDSEEINTAEETIADGDPSRDKMREMLRTGKLDKRSIELDIQPPKPAGLPMVEVISTGGSFDDISKNIKDMFSNMMPKGKNRKKVKIGEALQILQAEEVQRLLDMDEITKLAIERVEQSGMVFIDEIDKIASREAGSRGGPDVSREGVQRDILPIVEGSRVNTRYGVVATDHILFIAAGAFHISKPSDLIPELQGRFPIRVELSSLTEEDFLKILTEPQNSLVKQYTALMDTEKVNLIFTDDALNEIARYATMLNEKMENIGARRLHTIIEKVLDDISFTASEKSGESFEVNASYVNECLKSIVEDQDLSRYIL